MIPKRKIGSPGPPDIEKAGRDAALELLKKSRAKLVAIAFDTAVEIAKQRGRVSSVEVFAMMRSRGYDAEMDGKDPRWMGAVFNDGDVWVREGWELTGSHRRPVAIWKLKDPSAPVLTSREKVLRTIRAVGRHGASVEHVMLATGFSRSVATRHIADLLLLDLILETNRRVKRIMSRGYDPTYVVPEFHSDII